MAGFKKAVKHAAKLRMALVGPSGSGKTWTALELAKALSDGQPVAVVDTERGSASKYADTFSFDVLELDTFHPNSYIQAIAEAAREGYAVVVLDSLSHAWNGRGGILEIVQRKGNSFQAWGEVKPIENALIEAITSAPIHVIATMRSKTEYVVETNDKGKSAPRKVGTAPVQRDGLEYEFDVFGELDQENTLTINKTRCSALTGAVIAKPGKPLAATLKSWLAGAPAPAPTPPASSNGHSTEPQRPTTVEQRYEAERRQRDTIAATAQKSVDAATKSNGKPVPEPKYTQDGRPANWSTLRLWAREHADVATLQDWEDCLADAIGKTDPKKMTAEDFRRAVPYFEEMAAKKARAEAKVKPAEPEPSEPDDISFEDVQDEGDPDLLTKLPTGAGVH